MNNIEITTSNFDVRFEGAMKELRKRGVVARRNIGTCCRGCYDPKVTDDQAIIWHYGGQGNRFMVCDDGLYEYTYERSTYSWRKMPGTSWPGSPIDKIYFNHSNLVAPDGLTPAGQAVVETFAKYGLVLDWDRTDSKCIGLDVQASVVSGFKYEDDVTLALV